ncbi:MAG TPA: hypothetical protein VIJ55_11785 [Acetobacteraceae bacterium]
MRALKAATIVMGILIVVGTAVLIAVIFKRANAPHPAAGGGLVPSAARFATMLHEPAGTRITGLAAIGDALALSLQGGGADRVILIDPRTGETRGRITLAP